MTTRNNNPVKHLLYDDRLTIEKMLKSDKDIKLKTISDEIGKDLRGISREIKKNRLRKLYISSDGSLNHLCKKLYECNRTNACGKCHNIRLCKNICNCISHCPQFTEDVCERLLKFPHVCNGCEKYSKGCRKNKYVYRAKESQESYEYTLKDSRLGINISTGEIADLNDLFEKTIKDKNQPVYHVFKANEDKIPFTIRTFYNYVEKGALCIKNHDLERKVRYKKRKIKSISQATKRAARENRTYDNYLEYIATHDVIRVQMDTVEGKKSDKNKILTIHIVEAHFMFAFLLPGRCADHVYNTFNNIQEKIGIETFKVLFDNILTDNGSEFCFPENLEYCPTTGELRTRIFYCNPNRSDQKAHVEKNHAYIRYVLPQGKSISDITQGDLDILMSNINSTMRNSLGNLTPYELMCKMFGEEIINKLGIKKVHPDKVNLSKDLLKK